MSLRSFEHDDEVASVAVQRVDMSRPAGTLDSQHTFAAVSGMSALPAVVQHMTSAQVMRTLGKIEVDGFRLCVDNDHMPSGGVLKAGDHVVVASGIYQGTYEVQESTLVQGREWNCVMALKPETKT